MILYMGVQKVSMRGTDWCILVDSDGYIYRLWLDFSSGIFGFSKPAPSATWVPLR